MRRKIAAGNWKMNGTTTALSELATLAGQIPANAPNVVICPPATLLIASAEACAGTGVSIGAQDCHMQASGAYTGDISASMVADTGAGYVIIGHSERRDAHAESDADVNAKAQQVWGAGLTAILCIGESGAVREAGTTLEVIAAQLAGSLPDAATGANCVIAYEPIWAIGTGKVPTLEQIVEVHDFIRAGLVTRFGAEIGNRFSLLYGGSVKPDNAATIFEAENVDGALVGGASLKASDFAPIIAALAAS
ncbi:triose-phosphate isomerase [Sulfitobacter sp. SK012]|uniref:triose-phosphate isomerase n=1 Tax=Sulfitobacter sp. SK012 TaxID=1389005 RepID=UPI000E0A6AEF|nr:triose-phosphate isomerase [Sulfitobacter sp. SK012]AXI46977.1 triose-phosphate isomerase [Sulfitobacter sp. SK012]